MALLIIPVVCLFLLSFLAFYREKKRLPDKNMIHLSTEDTVAKAKELVRNAVVERSGEGVHPAVMMRVVQRENRLIGKKIRLSVPLTDAEKWFYENFYLVRRYIYAQKDTFTKLPHVNGTPRVVALCEIIVDHSLRGVTVDRVRSVMDGIRFGNNFLYAEYRAFEDAFRYAVTEQIYILAQRLLYQESCREKAYRKKFDEALLKSPTYVHTLFKTSVLSAEIKEKIKKRGLDEKAALLEYNDVLAKNAAMAKTLFTALREVGDYLPAEIGLEYLSSYRVLCKEKSDVSIDTLSDYFGVVEEVATRCRVSEDYCAEKATELANEKDVDVSVVLFDKKRSFIHFVKTGKIAFWRDHSVLKQRLYVWSILLVSAAISVGIGFVNVVSGVLSFVPVLFCVENGVNYLLSHVGKRHAIPKMKYKEIPPDQSVAIVISEYVSSMQRFFESLAHAERINVGNGGKNVQTILLVDTKGKDLAVTDLDREIMEYLKTRQTDVNVLLRKKTEKNGIFIAEERKRGAILALNKLFVTHDERDFFYVHQPYYTPEYVLTLDADNELLPGETLDFVNVAAHPYNEKYDLFACHSRYDLYSLKTPFSERFLSESGCETYPTFTGLYYDLFRRDLYCGKGLYRLKNFYEGTEEVFPSEKILSHDILEGSVLQTASGGTIFEAAPQGFLSDRERKKRWIRGDVQLLPFLFGRWKNDHKETFRAGIEPINRFVMVKNVLASQKELFLLALFLFGLFFRADALFVAAGVFVAPYAINGIKALRGITRGDLPRYVLSDCAKIVLSMTEDLLLTAYYAVENLILLAKTIGRMIFKKNLLEWKTFYDSQTVRSASSYAREFTRVVVVMTIVTAIYLFNGVFSGVFVGVYALFTLPVMMELYLSSLPKEKEKASDAMRLALRRYAEKTYRYFTFMESFGEIIPDNLQIKPYKGVSETTSPTNIGFSILARICAYELRFCTYEECAFSIYKIFDAVEKLPKWKGNLYNWYSVRDLQPVSQFVSCVDCGNFSAALIVAKNFFKRHDDAIGELRAKKLLLEGDLASLYDERKNLFYLGYDGEKYIGHYDLYNSESRLLSVVFASYYKKFDHFPSLMREYTSYYGNTLLSWSGTAFETLLPELFIETPEHSLANKTARNNVKAQKNASFQGLWGISESGQYRFDEDRKYQYYAFGINKMAVRNEDDQAVISPYSSFLSLSIDPRSAVDNLASLEQEGMLGEYGFYESYDLRGRRNIVSSFMSHHQGMSLCAMTNFLCENAIKNYFTKDEKIESCLTYFNENMPKGYFGYKMDEKHYKSTDTGNEYSKNIANIEQYYSSVALTDGKMSVVNNANGSSFVKNGDRYIDRFSFDYYDLSGGLFIVQEDEKSYSPTYLPFRFTAEKEDFSFSFDEKTVRYENNKKRISEEITLLSGLDGVVKKLICGQNKRVYFHSALSLVPKDQYDSHPAYNGLFLDVEIFGNVALFRRRSLEKEGKDYFLAVRVNGLSTIRWECNEMNFIGRDRFLSSAKIFEKYGKTGNNSQNQSYDAFLRPSFPSHGDVLYPCVGLTGKTTADSCEIVMMCDTDREKLLDRIRSLPEDTFSYALCAVDRTVVGEKTQAVIGELLYRPYEKSTLSRFVERKEQDSFLSWVQGKKHLVYTFSEKKSAMFSDFLMLLSDLRVLCIDVSVGVYFPNEPEEKVRRFVEKNLADFGVKNPAFYVDEQVAKKYAFLFLRSDLLFLPSALENAPILCDGLRSQKGEDIDIPTDLYESGQGGFDHEDRYVFHAKEPSAKPYSNVVAGPFGGFLTTENGGGYFFFENSRENKASVFENDPVLAGVTEALYLCDGEDTFRINDGVGNNAYVLYDRGVTTYYRRHNGVSTQTSYSCICDGLARVVSVEVSSEKNVDLTFLYKMRPCLDWRYDPTFLFWDLQNDFFTIKNVKTGRTIYGKILVENTDGIIAEEKRDFCFSCSLPDGRGKIDIVVSGDRSLVQTVSVDALSVYRARQKEAFFRLNVIDVTSKDRSFSLLSKYLPYQAYSSRLNGKLGFYQVGGATGFRDQLQDVLAFLHVDPSLCREQILRSCRHQYKEGDVMHWWHEPKWGLRTKISDDKLFLPLVCAEYLAFSEDFDLLNEKTPYLVSRPLGFDETTRYEDPPYTEETYSVKDHCLAAIRSSLKFGEHGLVVMGGGDWNDGMDDVGRECKGESVFTSMLLYEVLTKFSAFCDESGQKELLRIAEEVKRAINEFAFEKDRYKRLFTDDGRWLGSERSPTLTLDLLTQSYAVISGVASKDRAETVLNTAKSLIDYENGLIRLLDPPQNRDDYLGYISAYPPGIRENGGQYTHAAMWYLIALTKIGRQDEAYDLLQRLNPIEKCRDKRKNAQYGAEPYVLAGDVYTNEQNYGQAGWTWYTGSAAWAYRLIVEGFFGLIRRGKKLLIEPKLPKALNGAIVSYHYQNSEYLLEYQVGDWKTLIIEGERETEELTLEPDRRKKVLVTAVQ